MTQVKVGTLWAGGWDDYLVDTDDQIDDDCSKGTDPIIMQEGATHSGFSQWLRTTFSGALRDKYPGKAVRIVQHLGGGD